MSRLSSVSISDFKLIFRDNSLRIFLAMPLLIFLIVMLAVPGIFRKLPRSQGIHSIDRNGCDNANQHHVWIYLQHGSHP